MQKKIPQRQCMGCRERKAKRELIRVVRSPEGEVSLDFGGRVHLSQSRVPEKGHPLQSAGSQSGSDHPGGGLPAAGKGDGEWIRRCNICP